MLAYIFIGYFLDRWLDTTPWLLIAGAITGMFAFFIQLVRLVKRLSPPGKAGDDEHDRKS